MIPTVSQIIDAAAAYTVEQRFRMFERVDLEALDYTRRHVRAAFIAGALYLLGQLQQETSAATPGVRPSAVGAEPEPRNGEKERGA